MPTLQDRIIIITGSTRGFGYAIAQACLAVGAVVVITGRSQEAIDRALSGLQEPDRTAGFIVDVQDEAQVHHLAELVIQKYGHFDIWINNAGYSSAAQRMGFGRFAVVDKCSQERVSVGMVGRLVEVAGVEILQIVTGGDKRGGQPSCIIPAICSGRRRIT